LALFAVFLRHIFAVAEIASQFLYRNRKNVVYSRNVMRNWAEILWKKQNYGFTSKERMYITL
jgi:hypothetical protein